MRRKSLIVPMMLAGVFFAKAAFCEAIQGMVTYLDPVNRMIGVRETAAPGKVRQHVFTFDRGLKTDNAGPVQDLQTGQVVIVEARKDGAKQTLEADSIRVTGD